MRLSRESSANVQDLHRKAKLILCHVKDFPSVRQGSFVARSIATARSNVKGNANNIESVLLGGRKERAPLDARRSKLGTQATLTSTIVCDDSEDQLNLLANLSAL
jgi:hypothetical protein